MEVLLSELYLSYVEQMEAGYGVALVDDGGSLALHLREDYVHEVLRCQHHRDLLEVVLHHPCCCFLAAD